MGALLLFGVATCVQAQPARDLTSDAVGSTAGVFRVDESGQATYAIAIAVPPGTAGVAPTLSLNYSSQGPNDVLGKGWSIGGQSSIGRCRQTREAGDFYNAGVPYNGNSMPVGLHNGDAFCLDGQRLLLVSGTYGANGAIYRPELDPWTRVTSKDGDNSGSVSTYTGPNSFTVERKDGSISEYGSSADARIERNQCGGATGIACAVSTWALNRVEDSTGNYLTYHYTRHLNTAITTAGDGADEFVLSEVRYTGKRVLSGQAGVASNPYARVLFGYSTAAANERQFGWQSGSRLAQTQRLDWIKVQDPYAGTPRTLRYYGMGYATSGSNSGSRRLASVQECNQGPGDTSVDGAQVCYPATTFTESAAKYQFNLQADSDVTRDVDDRKGARYGDVDGDGRLDLVWIQDTNESLCKSRIYVSYGDRLVAAGASQLTLATPAQEGTCLEHEITETVSEHESLWHLLDYDGDGRDDLMLAGPMGASSRWRIHGAAAARPTSASLSAFSGTDLLASVAIPVSQQTARYVHLIDLDGDGLMDVLYPKETTVPLGIQLTLHGRLRERYEVSPGVFALRFGAESAVTAGFAPSDPCSTQYTGTPKPTSCSYTVGVTSSRYFAAAEFDGDGRGDLMMQVARSYDPARPSSETQLEFVSPERFAEANRSTPTPSATTSTEYHWYFFVSRSHGATLALESFDSRKQYDVVLQTGEMPFYSRHVLLADFNGDALTDLLYRVPSVSSGQTWRLSQNTGHRFSATTADAIGITHPDLAQVADANGDGRADLLYPPDGNTCGAGDTSDTSKPFCVRYGQAGSPDLTAARHVSGRGAQTTNQPGEYEHYFADFDGDGATDYVRFKRAGGASDLFTSRSSTRHEARDVITTITDGLGAITQIDYEPLTNAGVYRRDVGSLTAAASGRGSPVFDLLAPMYVVSKANSSAPTYTDAAALSEVSYRYAGARMQSGGRGFLGFREIASFDGVHELSPARHVTSRTSYRQDFPFIGSADRSEKFVVASHVSHGSSVIDACRADPEVTTQSCFYSVGAVWPAPSGTKMSESLNIWACQGTGDDTTCPIPDNPLRQVCIDEAAAQARGAFNPLGTQQPIFPYLTGSIEDAYAYNTATSGNGNKLSSTVSAFCYEEGYGNLTYSKVDHWDDTKPVKVQITDNTWSNDATTWRLGRLTGTTVDVSDSCVVNPSPGGGPICSSWKSRRSSFDYDTVSAAKTGLLNQQKLQPGGGADQELRTLYTLDAYGNQTHAFTCSAFEADGSTLTEAECQDTSRVRHRLAGEAGAVTAVHRYARSTFDANGRYLTSTRLPYYSASGTNNLTELAASTIDARDEFGNVTQQTDVNGKISTSRAGALGRPYYAGDNTGASSTTTFRWCSSVSCPIDAVYRSQTVAAVAGAQSAAPTAWTYYDKLGRPILTATQAFAAGVTGQDFSAACSYYDKKTRPERASEPLFLATAAASGAPDFQGGAYDPCETALWTRNEFDVLGRSTKTVLPDSSETTISYAGLVTTTTNAKSQIARETKNALGQVVQMTQANPTTPSSLGMSVDMAYDAHGNVRSLTRNAGQGDIVTTYEYDALGRRTKSIDPDRGTEHTVFNAAGEVIRTTDAAGLSARMDIDALGRVWRRYSGSTATASAPSADRIFGSGFEMPQLPPADRVTDQWEYDTANNGKGLLHSEERTSDSVPTYRRTMSYDARGRPSTRATLIEGVTTTEGWDYDALARAYRETDASGGTVERTFTNRGHLFQLRNASAPAEVYQQITAQNARGQVAQELRGAATITRGFHPQRGWLTGLSTSAASTLQSLSYQYDALGNVEQRRDLRSNQVEDFIYDGLNRLQTATVTVGATPAVPALNLTYDLLGNICSKNGAAYTYAGRDGCNSTGTSATAPPHAVMQIGAKSYRYGVGGKLDNATDSAALAQARWFGYDGLHQLTRVLAGSFFNPTAELEMRYGPSGERYLRRERVGASTTTTHYLGSVERITRPSGVVETRRTLGGVLIETSFSNGSPTTKRYLYHDALGSMDAITNEAGTLQERLSFDAHGNRRSGDDWRNAVTNYTPTTTPDGFTGHEHLDPFGLIHMNGRVYDPTMGRFIQPDPIDDAGIQGLNRYSYVLNNPLTLTDPSGYSSWNRWLRTVAAIVISYYSGGAAGKFYAAGNTSAAFGVTAAGGFAAGAVQTGTLKGGLYGAFGASAFFGVGTAFTQGNAGWAYNDSGGLTQLGLVAKTVAHGVVGGVLNDLQGGRFGHGFLSAGVTQAVSPQIDNINSAPGQMVATAVLGGTVSAATGGKFANGAVTAAFSFAFNQLAHASRPEFDVPEKYREQLPKEMVDAAYDDLYPLSGDTLEGGTMGYETSSGYSSIQMEKVARGEIPWSGPSKDLAYLTHTHGNSTEWYENYFSGDDTHAAKTTGKPVFLATRRGDFRAFLPGMGTGRTQIRTGPDHDLFLRNGQSQGILLCTGCMTRRGK